MPTPDPITENERNHALNQALDPRNDLSIRKRLDLLEIFRGGPSSPELRQCDEMILRQSVGVAREVLLRFNDMRAHIERLTAPPYFPAVYLGASGADRARVAVDGIERVVLAGEHRPDKAGEMVLLNTDRTLIMDRCPRDPVGEVASFQQLADGERVVVNHRGENLVCHPINGLNPGQLRKGDLVLIDARNHLAIEPVGEPSGGRLPFEVVDDLRVTPGDVGGLGNELETLLWQLLVGVEHREVALRHRLGGFTSVLLHGPPGTGKTLMARVAAAELQRRTGTRTRFVSVRPSEWRSEWVGATERAIRETFGAIRRMAATGCHTVVFLDEADSLGRARGTSRGSPVFDDFTNALLAELDGFSSLSGVAVISATNRKDLLDSALRERLAAVDIPVPRPRMAAARAIFRIHLREVDPWVSPDARDEAIETALSLIYAPAGDSNDISRLRFNDGSARVVKAAELCSGRLIQQISNSSRHAAARREVSGGCPGITVEDVATATDGALDGLRGALSRDNAAVHLSNLPQDLTIVAAEPIRPRRASR